MHLICNNRTITIFCFSAHKRVVVSGGGENRVICRIIPLDFSFLCLSLFDGVSLALTQLCLN